MTNKFQIFDGPCKPKIDRQRPKCPYWDHYVIGEGDELIGTSGLGICLAVTLYNPQNKRGILAHIAGFGNMFDKEALEPNTAIDILLKNLNGSGDLDYRKLEATLSGEGGFPTKYEGRRRNSLIIGERINHYGIPIIGEDLCSPYGREVFLDCSNGNVEVYRI